MKTTNLIMGKGTTGQNAVGSGGKVKLPAADRKVSPIANLKVKTPSFGETLDEARGSKGQVNQPKAAGQRTPAQKSDGSKAASSPTESDAVQAAETIVNTKETVNDPTTKATHADKPTKAEGKPATAAEEISEKPEEPTATTLNAMLMAMAANTLESVPVADASTAETEGAAPGDSLALPAEPRPMALEVLLPQDAAKTVQAAQNQQLMDMLSGSMVNTAETMSEGTWTAESVLAPEALPTDAVLTQAEPTAAAAVSENLSTASALTGETAEVSVEQPAIVANTANVVSQKGTADQASSAKNAANSLWQGIGLTVEDTITLPDAAMRTDVGDMAGGNSQQGTETPAALTDVSGRLTRQGAQLPEEAAFDTVKLTEGNRLDSTVQPMTSTFTPAVGLTNAAGTAGAVEAPPADGYEVVRQIVDQAKLVRTDGNASEMVIRLKPEHLGELTMRISVAANGAVNASFHTDNPQTRGLIESSMIQLKQELSAQGIKVDNVSVYSGLSEDFFANSQAGQQGYPQPQHSARSAKADRIVLTGDAEAVSAVSTERGPASSLDPNVGTADGVDYRV